MAITVIPFNMPEPMEIPAHLVEQLQSMPADAAVSRGMELLMQIEAADIMIYERVDADGHLQLAEAFTKGGTDTALLHALAADGLHGKPLADSSDTLAGQAFGQKSSLLIMGQHDDDGKTSPLPPALLTSLLGDAQTGNVGFLYVLTFEDGDRPLGALTLARKASEGPLNHEQPNLTQGLRLVLAKILAQQ
ncbi:MAG: hypothetical protein HOM68_21320 [Gemmatimonadetes bacterium]|jgi:hypothetical protein|nr:hypothetical protein [Gemmatimonadota bacterium]MBT4612337.1 hypothetical protein [Gemmatimonadota bacterium]MBT5059097.1 hypothetical protein [Gemmatimonadota bacterium]MBT5145697.1 hypothetical protein [Gemmatimonadota bacterium]MBT5588073.1 hypothetical protein [Gemmatimonadota bacterium]